MWPSSPGCNIRDAVNMSSSSTPISRHSFLGDYPAVEAYAPTFDGSAAPQNIEFRNQSRRIGVALPRVVVTGPGDDFVEFEEGGAFANAQSPLDGFSRTHRAELQPRHSPVRQRTAASRLEPFRNPQLPIAATRHEPAALNRPWPGARVRRH